MPRSTRDRLSAPKAVSPSAAPGCFLLARSSFSVSFEVPVLQRFRFGHWAGGANTDPVARVEHANLNRGIVDASIGAAHGVPRDFEGFS